LWQREKKFFGFDDLFSYFDLVAVPQLCAPNVILGHAAFSSGDGRYDTQPKFNGFRE